MSEGCYWHVVVIGQGGKAYCKVSKCHIEEIIAKSSIMKFSSYVFFNICIVSSFTFSSFMHFELTFA